MTQELNMRYSWLLAVFFCGLQMSLFAQAPADDIPVREQSMYQTFILLALALAFFYFILWRPEQKRRKAAEAQRAALKQGDRVSALGIIGTIVRLNENTVILKMYDGAKIEVYKGAINEVLPPVNGNAEAKKDEE